MTTSTNTLSKRAGASVNAYLILRQGNGVLLLLRKNTNYCDGMWSFPAGHIEDGESATEGMIREAREEVGIELIPSQLKVAHVMHRKTNRMNVDVFFACSSWSGAVRNCEPQKCERLEFFSINALPENIIEYNAQAFHAIARGEFYSGTGVERMNAQQEFYFIRHGQTNHNLLEESQKGDHPADIPLNNTGRTQAEAIEALVTLLPITTVCTSPMRRAQETKEIVTKKLQVTHHNLENFSECSAQEWKELVGMGMYSSLPSTKPANDFVSRIQNGLTQTLSFSGPTLIIAHGGVHWAICALLAIEEHSWFIDNCEVVHFARVKDKWSAKSLTNFAARSV